MGIGFYELVILAAIPAILIVAGVIVFVIVRGSKK